MTKEPKQVLPQQRRAAFVAGELAIDGNQRHEKTGAQVTIHEQQDAARKKDAKRQQPQDGSDEPRPAS